MKSGDSPKPSPLEPAVARRGGGARQGLSSQGAEVIKQRIKQGLYKPGERLPSLRVLGAELNLSVPAMQRAVQQLEREAIVESRHGVGIRVLDSANCEGTPLFFGFVQPYFSRFSLALQHYLEEALDSRSNLCVMKSAHNDPARERREMDRLISSGVSGLLLWPVDGDTNGPYLQQVAERTPLVLVDRTIAGVETPSVVLDYEGGARKILRDLSRRQRTRLLVVCDPAEISSFQLLKHGLRTEAAELGMADGLTIVDFPVSALIEASYEGDYALADACYAEVAPLLASGAYDALFCPQSEWLDQVFADSGRADVLQGIELVTLRTPQGSPHSRRYHQLGAEEWILDTAPLLVRALDLLQDMTLGRRPPKRTVKLPIRRAASPTFRV